MSILPKSIQDREYEKFDLNDNGDVVVRTTLSGEVSGTFSPSGLKIGGRVTEVVLSDSAWTALPPGGPLANRNAINLQNYDTGTQIKINFRNDVAYVGTVLNENSERNYDITDEIQLWARAQIGAPVLIVEEIS